MKAKKRVHQRNFVLGEVEKGLTKAGKPTEKVHDRLIGKRKKGRPL